ncbi:hypothetical protein JMN32_09625 [Fulvivirga sp. 29W222]|uniref:Uncharacterized protein n=1 Tax=Fulvivirga marina TaxID=2494733 RepID=A0A937KBU2_9BACT|nr:hypothetical protein [Fulvivirga marina]MBL6446569.1 hypothetical protein [Fulvivirga marina]
MNKLTLLQEMPNKKRYRLAFLLSFITAIATANDGNPELVKIITERLNKQIAQNTWNERNGKSAENNYIIDLSDVDFLNKETHVKAIGKPFVTETESVNKKLVELAEQNAISLYVLLNGHLLDFRYSSDGKKVSATKESPINTQEIIEASIKAAYNQSDLTKDETGRHALLGITPLTLYYLGKTEDKDLVPTHAFQRAVYPGKAFSGLKEQMNGKVSSFKYAGQDHNEVFEKHVDAYIQGLRDYKGDEPQSETTDEFTLADASKLTIINQKPLAAYVEDTKEKKAANYASDVSRFVASFKQLKGSNGFVSISEKFNAINPSNSKHIEDKIKAFNQETDGKYSIYVIIKEVEYYLDKVDWKKFSEDVNKEAGASQTELIITIPYTVYEDASIRYNTGALGVKDVFFPFPGNSGYGENGNGKALTDLLEYFNEVYSGLAKPYTILSFIMRFDGKLEYVEKTASSYITGQDRVLTFRYFEDKNISVANKYYEKVKELNAHPTTFNRAANIHFFTRYHELMEQERELSDYKYVAIEENIKESYIREYIHEFVSNHIYEEYTGFRSEVISQYNIPDEALWVVPDPIETVIDAGSVVFSVVGLDIVFDFAGTIYSLTKGDYANASFYAAGMAVPFATGGEVKLTRLGAEAISNIGKLFPKDADRYYLAAIFRVDDVKITKLLEMPGARDNIKNPKLLANIDVLDPLESSKLLDDILANDKLLVKYNEAPELVEAWTQLNRVGVNDRLRRNPEVLERVKNFQCK